ncbi:hypothetical protein STEG23_022795, partial [Scotinomys teguina]
ISLLASVHCKESWVWFEASGFCCTMDAGPSLGLLLDILLLPCVVGILQLWICSKGLPSSSTFTLEEGTIYLTAEPNTLEMQDDNASVLDVYLAFELGSPSPFLVRYIRRKAEVKVAAAQHQYGATVVRSISPSLAGFNLVAVRAQQSNASETMLGLPLFGFTFSIKHTKVKKGLLLVPASMSGQDKGKRQGTRDVVDSSSVYDLEASPPEKQQV